MPAFRCSNQAPAMHSIRLMRVQVECPDPELRQLLVVNSGAMASPDEDSLPDVKVSVQSSETSSSLSFVQHGRTARGTVDSGDLLFVLEKAITIKLQRRRADLYFLHAAAIALHDKVCLLAAPDVRAIGPAEASARLYVGALNTLAHTDHGLDAVARIGEHVPCFTLSSAGLPATCSLLRATFEQALEGAS